MIKSVLTNTTMWYIVVSESAFLDPSTLHSTTILKEGIKGKTITKKVNQRDRKEVLKMAKFRSNSRIQGRMAIWRALLNLLARPRPWKVNFTHAPTP